MSNRKLIKGELNWHEKINDNFEDLTTSSSDHSRKLEELDKDLENLNNSNETTLESINSLNDEINSIKDDIVADGTDLEDVKNNLNLTKTNIKKDLESKADLVHTHDQYLQKKDIDVAKINSSIEELQTDKVDKEYITTNIYTKKETYSMSEVNEKIKSIIGSAPETLDTLGKIADALNENPNFSTTILEELSKKVDIEEGKGLSDNNYSNEEKEKLRNLKNIKNLSELTIDTDISSDNISVGDDILTTKVEKIYEDINKKSNTDHDHNDIYAPKKHTHEWTEVLNKPSTYKPEDHVHNEYAKKEDVPKGVKIGTDLSTAVDTEIFFRLI